MQVLASKLFPLLLLRRPTWGLALLLQQGQALLWQGLCKPHEDTKVRQIVVNLILTHPSEDPEVGNIAMALISTLTSVSNQVQCLRRAYLLNRVHWRRGRGLPPETFLLLGKKHLHFKISECRSVVVTFKLWYFTRWRQWPISLLAQECDCTAV